MIDHMRRTLVYYGRLEDYVDRDDNPRWDRF
jgi:hypothetical protein